MCVLFCSLSLFGHFKGVMNMANARTAPACALPAGTVNTVRSKVARVSAPSTASASRRLLHHLHHRRY